MIDDTITEGLPTPIRQRIRTAKLSGGAATLVVDASGLDGAGRADLESTTRDILLAREDVGEVRVAMMADKPARRIIAVGSGKGGVGKSTLTGNLAVALASMGRKVGVVDADIYGPSQPTILANAGQRPRAEDNKLIPVESEHGVSVLSMGHLIEPGKAIAWRGPMVSNALGQLIDAHWGETELLLVDLPPGTGDIQLSMIQKYKPAGAVLVSTPQDLALIDAKRAAQLFEAVSIPIVGLVENMAGYACPHCGEISDPFGQGGVEAAAADMGVPFLGRIPLALSIREASDAGSPPATRPDTDGAPFHAIAQRLLEWLDA